MSIDQQQEYITVGKITSVYGIKGWVKVYSYTEPKENIFSYKPWFMRTTVGSKSKLDRPNLEPLEIDQHRPQGQGLVIHIAGVDDRNQAETFCQRDIIVSREQIPELPLGEYYWHQLQGLQVYSSSVQPPQLLGKIDRMLETGANDVMVVAACEGSIDERERWLPFVKDQYQTQVSLVENKITLDWDPDF